MADPKLVRYIRSNMDRFPIGNIRLELMKEGYAVKDINEAVAAAEGIDASSGDSEGAIKRYRKEIVAIALLLAVLGGAAAYLIYYSLDEVDCGAGTYNRAQKACEYRLADIVSCPQGTDYSEERRGCVYLPSSKMCDVGTYNQEKDVCGYRPALEAECEEGASFNAKSGLCEYKPKSEIVCTEGKYNLESGRCEIMPELELVCPNGSSYEPARDKCVMTPEVEAVCEEGAYNEASKKCEFEPEVEYICPDGSALTGEVCIFRIKKIMSVCSVGVYDAKSGSCIMQAPVTYACSQGTLVNTTGGMYCLVLPEPIYASTCRELGGVACSTAGGCSGNLINAADTAYCCDAQCSAPPQDSLKIVAPQNGVYLGAYNWEGDGVAVFEQAVGAKAAIAGGLQYIKDKGTEGTMPFFDAAGHEEAYQAGYITTFGIEHQIPSATHSPQAIIDGSMDPHILQAARDIKAWGRPLFWVYQREPMIQPYGYDGGGYGPKGDKRKNEVSDTYTAYGCTDSADEMCLDGPERYRDAARHIHDLVESAAPGQVTWVMGAGDHFDKSIPYYRLMYPGDSYVDWHAIDPYPCGLQAGCKASDEDIIMPYESPYDKSTVMLRYLAEIRKVSPTKPVMFVELGVQKRTGDRAGWFKEFFSAIKTQEYSQVGAILYWQEKSDPAFPTRIEPGEPESTLWKNEILADPGFWHSDAIAGNTSRQPGGQGGAGPKSSDWNPTGWVFTHTKQDGQVELSARMSPPIYLGDGTLITGSSTGHVYRLMEQTGGIIWDYQIDYSSLPYQYTASSESSGEVTAIVSLWGKELGEAYIQRIIQVGDIIVPETSNSFLVGINLDGQEVWRHDILMETGSYGNLSFEGGLAASETRFYAIASKISGINSGSGVASKEASYLFAFDKDGSRLWEVLLPGPPIDLAVSKNDEVYVTVRRDGIYKIRQGSIAKVFERQDCFSPYKVTILDSGKIVVGNNHQGCNCDLGTESFFVLEEKNNYLEEVFSDNVGCIEGKPVEKGGYLYFGTLYEDASFVDAPDAQGGYAIQCNNREDFYGQKSCAGKLHIYDTKSWAKIGQGMLNHEDIGTFASPSTGTDGAPAIADDGMVYVPANNGYVDVFYHNQLTNTLTHEKSILTTSYLDYPNADELDTRAILGEKAVFVTNQGGGCGRWDKSKITIRNTPCRLYAISLPGESVGALRLNTSLQEQNTSLQGQDAEVPAENSSGEASGSCLDSCIAEGEVSAARCEEICSAGNEGQTEASGTECYNDCMAEPGNTQALCENWCSTQE